MTQPLTTRQLGPSAINITPVTLGTWVTGGAFWGGADKADAVDAIRASIDGGITSIDTAPVYGWGESERRVGEAIKGYPRDQLQILTKFGLRWDTDEGTHYFDIKDADGREVTVHRLATKESVIKECEDSLKRLGVDHIDVYQHHWMDPKIPVEDTFEGVAKLIEQGKVRYAGVSNYDIPTLERARKVVPIVSDQPPYSMIRRDIEGDILPYAIEQNLGIVVYSPLQMGLLTGKVTEDYEFNDTDVRKNNKLFSQENRRRITAFLEKLRPIAEAKDATFAQLVIAWTVRVEGITAALVGARTPKQAKENAAAARIELTDDEFATIRKEAEQLELER